VLLDIQMPGASGLDVAASLGKPRPAVIFCTAYDQYAVDAFELSALDYLLKPVNRARLRSALDRVRAIMTPPSDSATATARDRAIEQLTQATGMAPTRFLARRGNRFRVVPAKEVVAFTFVEGVTHLLTRHRAAVDAADAGVAGPAASTPRTFSRCRGTRSSARCVKEAKPFSDGTGESCWPTARPWWWRAAAGARCWRNSKRKNQEP
jgi:two-component system LytT family response regulator